MSRLLIREAAAGDAEALCGLYLYHLTANPPEEPQNMALWREMLARFNENPLYHILTGEADGRIVSSVTLVIVENLTHNTRPYALIENVVTHAEHRGRRYATELMNRAGEIAKARNCYKIMLLTGSKQESTLRFYENCGYNCEDKTGFVKWL